MNRPLFPPRVGGILSNGNDLRLPAVFDPTVSHPMIDDFTMRAQRQRTRSQPPGVPMQYPLPLRNHPMWSGNNELGNAVGFAADANNRQTILKLEEWGPPEIWTVQLGMHFDTTQLAAANGFSVRAHVQPGVGGAVQPFELDWVYGATFSTVMNALTIIAEYDDTADIPSDLQLSVTIGLGKACNTPPTYTHFFAAAAGPGSTTFQIPKFARSVFFADSTNAGTSVWSANCGIQLMPAAGGGAGLELTGDQLLTLGGEIPIPNGSRFVRVGNNGAGPAPDMLGVAIFKLSF